MMSISPFSEFFHSCCYSRKCPTEGLNVTRENCQKGKRLNVTRFNSRFPSWQLTPHSHKRSMCGSKLYLLFLNKKLSRFVSIQKQTFQNKLKSVTNSPFITHTTSLRQFFFPKLHSKQSLHSLFCQKGNAFHKVTIFIIIQSPTFL